MKSNSLPILTLLLLLTITTLPLPPAEARSLKRKPSSTSSIDRRVSGGGGGGGGRGTSGGGRGTSGGGSRPSIGKRPKGTGSFDGGDDGGGGGEGEEGECFPGSAAVWLADGNVVRMSALRVGDVAAQPSGERGSEVFTFSHGDSKATATFVRLVTGDGNLTATRGHILHTGDGLRAAGRIRVGDALVRAGGERAVVHAVEAVAGKGLYNAHTMSGELIVNGFRVTSYTTAVVPRAGEGLLAPLRALYRVTGTDVASAFLRYGAPAGLTRRLGLRG